MSTNVKLNQDAFDDAVVDGVQPVIRQFIYDLRNRMIVSFNEPRSGREYKRGSRVHQASAPGEAPGVDTGNLQNSIQVEFPSPIKGVLTIGAEYAQFLEDGTGRIAPRPFVVPALKGALEQLS